MFVEQILPRARERLVVVDAGTPVRDVADLMAKSRIDMLVVCNAGAVAGVVTKTDIIAQIGRGQSGFGAAVETIMTRHVTHCRATDLLRDVWQVMKECGLHRIPVVDEGHNPIGIVYTRDALQVLLSEVEIEDELLRDYVSGVGYR
jgi:CBS domain-containing protein